MADSKSIGADSRIRDISMRELRKGPRSARVPTVPIVRIAVAAILLDDQNRPESYCIHCFGTEADLVAAGVATPEMLVRPGKGRAVRRDADGDTYRVLRYWRSKNGQPFEYCRVERHKRAEVVRKVPGAMEAIETIERYHAYIRRQLDQLPEFRREPKEVEPTDVKQRTPYLRLVVDNSGVTRS